MPEFGRRAWAGDLAGRAYVVRAGKEWGWPGGAPLSVRARAAPAAALRPGVGLRTSPRPPPRSGVWSGASSELRLGWPGGPQELAFFFFFYHL